LGRVLEGGLIGGKRSGIAIFGARLEMGLLSFLERKSAKGGGAAVWRGEGGVIKGLFERREDNLVTANGENKKGIWNRVMELSYKFRKSI